MTEDAYKYIGRAIVIVGIAVAIDVDTGIELAHLCQEMGRLSFRTGDNPGEHTIVFGLIPVVRFARPQLTNALKEGGRLSSAGKARHRARNTLVVAEIALAVVLLVASGLMIRTFLALQRVEALRGALLRLAALLRREEQPHPREQAGWACRPTP